VKLVPKGYDLLFHLGNVFALQVKYGLKHASLASWGISPVIFHDYGYGTHLFYPPMAHFIPALISFVLSKVGINSTLLAIRLFSFLTIFGSGISMYYVAKKISQHTLYALFACLLYLSAPYIQMDYYWRGGMSSSLCFVFLPFLVLSLYYFIREKYSNYFFTLVASMTCLMWTHVITAFYSALIFAIAIAINFWWTKQKKTALIHTVLAGIATLAMTSPFWILLAQQTIEKTHVIFSPEYPFTIKDVAQNTISLKAFYDIQFKVWEFKIRNLFAVFTIVTFGFFFATLLLVKPIQKATKQYQRFIYSLIGLLVLITCMVTQQWMWRYLPNLFAFIQYPHRLLGQFSLVISFVIALPFVLIKSPVTKIKIALGGLSLFVIAYTYVFNNYQLYELGTIDYTTHSIIQAMGVEQEYLPINTKNRYKELDNRPYALIALTNNASATPSAQIVENQTPYLKAVIDGNESKQTSFELPRLYYAGYTLRWQADNSKSSIVLPYTQSNNGLITTAVPGNGTLTVQYTGGIWYPIVVIIALGTGGWVIYTWCLRRKRT
jgi:hypothetical protein